LRLLTVCIRFLVDRKSYVGYGNTARAAVTYCINNIIIIVNRTSKYTYTKKKVYNNKQIKNKIK